MNIVYSTGCPRCNVLIKKLVNAGIEFEEVTDTDEMHALGIDAVPVLKVGEDMLDFVSAVSWISKQGVAQDEH